MPDIPKNRLISIVGPTAVGKTQVAVQIASWLGTEIISADSRQFYKELTIGTAKPDKTQLTTIKHHFIDSRSIHDEYNVGAFEKEAVSLLNKLFQHQNDVLLVGGSGLFCKAIWEGLDTIPGIKEETRKELNEVLRRQGLSSLQQELEAKDPSYFARVDLHNPQRIIRALEVIRETGKPFSSFHNSKKKNRAFENLKIGLELPREELYFNIDHRMDQMISQGLFEEAKLFYPYRHLNALQTVGYSEIFGYLAGKYDKEEAIRLLKRNSRRYAKRQLTWFKRDPEIHWYHPRKLEEMKALIESWGNSYAKYLDKPH